MVVTVPLVTVKASQKITLDTPEVVCTNKLTTGTLEVKKGGKMSGNIEHSGGTLPEPNISQTKLINEKWRAALNKISVDAKKKNYVIAELVIQSEVGGFWLREMGLYDADGTLVAVANMAESYKPELAEGLGARIRCAW